MKLVPSPCAIFARAAVAAAVLCLARTPNASAQVVEKPLNSIDAPLKSDKPLLGDKAMSIKEVCLQLRSGYTNEEVLAEVASRRLLEPVDPAAEKLLTAAGAGVPFVAAIKAGNFNLSPADAAAARDKQAAIAQREQAGRAAQAQLAAATQAANQQRQAQADAQLKAAQVDRGKGPTLSSTKSPNMANLLRGKLMVVDQGKYAPYKDDLLATKRVFGIYFSASWCPPCQHFTPRLVQFYDKMITEHLEFEMVLVCRDKTAADMQKYMVSEHMLWPAIPFDKISQMPALNKLAGKGIPDLVLVDDSGRVVSDSYRGDQYVGPEEVVRDLVRMLTAS